MSLADIAARLETSKPRTLKFGLYGGEGWVSSTTDEAVVRLLCDVWNNRRQIAAALRASADDLDTIRIPETDHG